MLSRNTLAAANAIWKAGPVELRQPWEEFAKGKVLSGFNAWVGRYVKDNLGQPDFAKLVFTAKVNGGLPPAALNIFAFGLFIIVEFTLPQDPEGWILRTFVAGAIVDQNPAAVADPLVIIGPNPPLGETVVIFGLQPSTKYAVSGWITWLMPDGTSQIGQSPEVVMVTTGT